MMGNSQAKIDLSTASDHGIRLILLEMPAKDLLKTCPLISRQWYRILHANSFWIEKSEHDGYKLEWPRFAGLSLHAFQNIAAKHPFGRNLVRDSWDLSKQSRDCYNPDPRWESNQIVWTNNDQGSATRIEVPPRMYAGPKPDPDTGEEITTCLATSYSWFWKRIVIELAKEGLTDEIMDNFRPTIVVSELVTNRKDCGSVYRMHSKLVENPDQIDPSAMDRAYYWNDTEEAVEEAEQGRECFTQRIFAQWQDESWHKVEHVFSKYPPRMRYLVVNCGGKDNQFWAGNYGVKMAKFSVKALCESNIKSGKIH